MTAHGRWLRIGSFCLVVTSASGTSTALAEPYPTAPVKFITSMAAGGGTDPAMRIVIDQLGRKWGQQTLLVNQPGAGGALATRAAINASPDGHTLYMAIASIFTSLPVVQPNLPFNVNDFVPIGFVGEVPIAIAVNPSFPANSILELVSLSKDRRGGLNVAIGQPGGATHLTTELFRSRSGAVLTSVPYPGIAQAMADVTSGRIPVAIDGLGGPIGGGQLRLLGITSPARLPSRPEIPTVAESVPGFVSTGWFVLVAPPGTPDSIVEKVRSDLYAVLDQPDVRQKLDALSISTRPMSPQQLREFIRSEQEVWRPVVDQVSKPSQ
jgi:tripartite-type tricarboxylate transporter receptor subunit TctC